MPTGLSNLNDETLRQYLSDKKQPLLLVFWAPWCGPCTVMEPMLREIAVDYQKRLQVGRLNVDENAHAPAEFGIKAIPHLVLIDKGEVVASLSGPQPKAKVLELLERRLQLS
jgi:thioredoxin 1